MTKIICHNQAVPLAEYLADLVWNKVLTFVEAKEILDAFREGVEK